MQTHPDSVGQTEGLFYQPRGQEGGVSFLSQTFFVKTDVDHHSSPPHRLLMSKQTPRLSSSFCVINVLGSNIHV